MALSPSEFYSLLRPSPCQLRVYLKAKGEPEDPPSPYEQVIRQLGLLHEQRHLAALSGSLDLSGIAWQERERRTGEALRSRSQHIYHPLLRAQVILAGEEFDVIGEPDFILCEPGGLVVRDCKIALRINDRDHPEILRSVELYGWLLQQVCGERPLRIEVANGRGDLIQLAYDGGVAALKLLEEIVTIRRAEHPPYEPVGWTRCGDCGFNSRCWQAAEASQDVATLVGVDQSIARCLHELDVPSIPALVKAFDEDTLADVKRQRGTKLARIGSAATRIMRSAEAVSGKREIWLQRPTIPAAENYVMIDCEGLPPQLDETDKVYLWGLQVFGNRPGGYVASLGSVGKEGDEDCWRAFLGAAERILDEYGGIPFVHWAVYERVKLDGYVARFGDPSGVAARVRGNLFDLFPITRDSVVLPLPSYSLKVIERHVGFARTIADGSGDWAMAKYVEAVETEDEQKRQALMAEICAYNREDLEATWAVFKWLQAGPS